MPQGNFNERLETLELRVNQLQEEVCAAQQRPPKDWRRSIGVFTGDEGMQEIFREAMRLREADRKKARSRKSGKRKTP